MLTILDRNHGIEMSEKQQKISDIEAFIRTDREEQDE